VSAALPPNAVPAALPAAMGMTRDPRSFDVGADFSARSAAA
jgi:hypothetical protein